jgi:hypothetical protein
VFKIIPLYLNNLILIPSITQFIFLSSFNNTSSSAIVRILHDYHLLGADNHHSHRRGNLKSYVRILSSTSHLLIYEYDSSLSIKLYHEFV